MGAVADQGDPAGDCLELASCSLPNMGRVGLGRVWLPSKGPSFYATGVLQGTESSGVEFLRPTSQCIIASYVGARGGLY